jgi:hypothetical protein
MFPFPIIHQNLKMIVYYNSKRKDMTCILQKMSFSCIFTTNRLPLKLISLGSVRYSFFGWRCEWILPTIRQAEGFSECLFVVISEVFLDMFTRQHSYLCTGRAGSMTAAHSQAVTFLKKLKTSLVPGSRKVVSWQQVLAPLLALTRELRPFSGCANCVSP